MVGGAQAILEVRDDLLLAVGRRREAWHACAHVAESPHAAFGRANSDTSTRASARDAATARRARASVCMKTPEPCETRCTRTSSALGLLEHGLEAAWSLRRRDLDAILGTVREIASSSQADRAGRRLATRSNAGTSRSATARSYDALGCGMRLAPELVERFAAAADIIREPEQLRTYECDGLTGRRVVPALVALPGRRRPRCRRSSGSATTRAIPFVARGAGTGLSGGALPVADGIVISLARMNRVLAIDVERGRGRRRARRDEPRRDARRRRRDGFYYAPDPSSQQVCTIGGNVAENSGGAHCLKYGFTVNHVLAAEIVLPDGELRRALGLGRRPGSARRVRRLRGDARDRDEADAAHSARAGGGAHAARRVRAHRRRGRRGLRRRSPPGSCPPRSR